jgi:putative Ca2+/H+ antiporter (TMEM165/GDT1 family)
VLAGQIVSRFMWKKPENPLACRWDEWQAGAWGCNPHQRLFPLEEAPQLAVEFFTPADVLCNIAALAFIGMGALIWREASAESEDCDGEEAESGTLSAGGWNWKAFGSTAALLFFAELGDKTQLAVMGMASKQPSPVCVLIGGALALMVVTGIGVIGGCEIAKRIPERLLLKVSAVAFVMMGALMLAGVL